MPSVMTHSLVGAVVSKLVTTRSVPKRFWVLSIVLPSFPDIDVIGMAFGVAGEDLFGHRGITHSLFFAVVVGVSVVAIFFRKSNLTARMTFLLALYFVFLTASHGVLDAFNDSRLGVAFFAPFENTRYFFPYNPIDPSSVLLFEESSFGVGLMVEKFYVLLRSEILWIWIPLFVLLVGKFVLPRFIHRSRS